MTHVLMPFLMSMLLGRTIDLRTYLIGGDLFDDQDYNEVKMPLFNTSYIVLQDNNLPYNHMGLPVDIALRIKSGILNAYSGAMGLDGLLRDSTWKKRSVAVIVATAVHTVQRTLKEDAKPILNWSTRISKAQTHYTNSIIYGGWSFVLYQFKCDIPGDVEIVRETLTKTLGMYGDFGPKFVNSWKKAVEAISERHEIRGHVEVLTHQYSTFPFKHGGSNPENLLEAIKEIPSLVGPVGKPVYMELLPLHKMDPSYPLVHEHQLFAVRNMGECNRWVSEFGDKTNTKFNVRKSHPCGKKIICSGLDSKLEELDAMYDDVKNTKHSIISWLAQTDKTFTEEQDAKISDLVAHLSGCLKKFHAVASDASIYKNMDEKLLNSAFTLYRMELSDFIYSYDRIFRRLKEEIDADCKDEFLHRIKGFLDVDDFEKINLGSVEGGLQECKNACLALPECRSVGYIDRMTFLQKVKDASVEFYKKISKQKLCYVFLRSSSTADVVPPIGASVAGVYDRKCT